MWSILVSSQFLRAYVILQDLKKKAILLSFISVATVISKKKYYGKGT